MHVSINGPAVEDKAVLLEERIDGGSREELLGDIATCAIVNCGFPVVLEVDDNVYPMLVAGPEPAQAGIGQIGWPATLPQTLVAHPRLSCHFPPPCPLHL
jgi:hypothetical protein